MNATDGGALRRLRRAAISVAALAAFALASAACGAIQEDEPRSAVFMAGFKPQANLPFAAAYVAPGKRATSPSRIWRSKSATPRRASI